MAIPGAAKKKKSDQGVRGGLLLLGLLLVILSGGGFWYVLRELDTRQEYLVTVRTIEQWEVVGPGHFGVVAANIGTADGVPPEFVDLLIGQWATGSIPANTIVAPGMFQPPPLSGPDEAGKVLIEVDLPAGEAPGGSFASGDKIALFGAEYSGVTDTPSQVEFIGVLELQAVQGDTISYVVTPEEAQAIQGLVSRYSAAADRRMWKVGFDLSAEELIDAAR